VLREALAAGVELRINGPDVPPPGVGDRPLLTLVTPSRIFTFVGEEDPEVLHGASKRHILEVAPDRVPCARAEGCLRIREHIPRGPNGYPLEKGVWQSLPQEIGGYRHDEGSTAVLRVKRFWPFDRPFDRPVGEPESILVMDSVIQLSPPPQRRSFLEVEPQRVPCGGSIGGRCLRVREVTHGPTNSQGYTIFGEFIPPDQRQAWLSAGPWQVSEEPLGGYTHVPGRRQVLFIMRWTARDAAAFGVRFPTRLIRVIDDDLDPHAVAASGRPSLPPPEVVPGRPRCQGSPCFQWVP
jgi:hypothetical protein